MTAGSAQHATHTNRAGHTITVTLHTGPDPGTTWHCHGCGDQSDWPITNTPLVDMAAQAHALTCHT